MRFVRLTAILIGLPLLALAQSKSPTSGILDSLTANIDIEGLETNYDPDTGIASAKGEAHIKYGDMEMEAGRADYNANTGDIIAKDHVTIVKGGVTYKGENLLYNVNSNEMKGDLVRSGLAHDSGNVFYSVHNLRTTSRYVDKVEGEDATVTTHDFADPSYHITAKSITIYPNDRLIMRDVKVYVGDTPVFWFPYITQALDDENGYIFSPGYSSPWGAYLLNQYSVIYGDHTLARYHFDLRSTRGVAGGVDLVALKQKDNTNWGRIKFYYVNDSSPLKSVTGEDRTNVPTQRYRFDFRHRIYLTEPGDRTWYLDFDINKLSDPYFLEDYFSTEYTSYRQPDNQISLVRQDPRYTATLMARFRLNNFYESDTRLPELAFDFTRQPVFNTGVFYQGTTSLDVTREKLGSLDQTTALEQQTAGNAFLAGNGNFTVPGQDFGVSQSFYNQLLKRNSGTLLGPDDVAAGLLALQNELAETGYTRVYSYHELLYPTRVFGFLNLVPRIGGGFANYSDIRGSSNPDLTGGTRSLFHLGLDASFKLSKTWDEVHNESLGIDGLKHTFQPYVNYSYLNASNIDGLPQIDRNVPTTRPLPLDIPFYTGIDSLTSWNAARVGVRNLLSTKRDYSSYTGNSENPSTDGTSSEQDFNSNGSQVQAYNVAGLNSYVELYSKDPEGLNRDHSNLYNEFYYRPVPWITFSADTQLPLGGTYSYTEANYGITFMPNRDLSFSVGNEYLQDHPFFPNSNLIYTRIYARLDDNWGFSMNHIYEAATSTLQYQSYALHRDLNAWVASFGFLQRDNGGIKDVGVVFSMTLKDFPRATIPLDTDPNPTGRSLQ